MDLRLSPGLSPGLSPKLSPSKNSESSPIRTHPYILTDREYEDLNWSGEFTFPGMVRIRTIADGSCYFHAIANAYYPPYQTGILNDKAISKTQIVRSLRSDLALRLAQPVDPLNPISPLNYDLLGRGQLKTFALGMLNNGIYDRNIPIYTLENMQRELRSGEAIDNVYHEFISNQLNKDIYILDGENQDVQFTGDDYDLLYKGRPSIVLYYFPEHYELVGIKEEKSIQTYFDPDSEFIQAINQRLNLKRK